MCVSRIWGIAIQEKLKVCLKRQRRLEFVKKKEGIYINCFEQNVIGASIATVTLIYMWLVVRASVRWKVFSCPFDYIADVLAFNGVQQRFQEVETEDVHKPHFLDVFLAPF